MLIPIGVYFVFSKYFCAKSIVFKAWVRHSVVILKPISKTDRGERIGNHKYPFPELAVKLNWNA